MTGQRSFSSLADGLLDITPETKLVSGGFFSESILFLFDMISLLTRLEVAEPNQGKANLTKTWLATDEVNRSLDV